MFLSNLYITFRIHSSLKNMQAAHTMYTYTASPYHQRTCWKVSLFFSLEAAASVINNKNIKFGLIWPWNNFRLLKWDLAHRTQRRFWTMFNYSFCFIWESFSWHLQMAQQLVFASSGFWKHSWAYLLISATQSYLRLTPCNMYLALSLMQRDTSSFSESFDDVMHCTVDHESCKAFAIWCWETLFLKYSIIFLCITSQFWQHFPIFTSERLSLSKTSLL